MDWTAFLDSAKRGLAPAGRPLQDRPRLLRVAVGMIAATVAAFFFDEAGALLVTIGAFLTAIAAIMPHDRSRLGATGLTSILMVTAAAAGLAVGTDWWAVVPVLVVMFFASGMLRAVSAGLSIRILVLSFVFLALAEMEPELPTGYGVTIGFFAFGVAIMYAAQFLPPFDGRNRAQRTAVGTFYRTVSSPEEYSAPALLAADRTLAHLRLRDDDEIDRLTQLTEYGEQIAQLLLVIERRPATDASTRALTAAVRSQTAAIGDRIASGAIGGPDLVDVTWPRPVTGATETALAHAVDAATALVAGRSAPPASDERRVPTSWELIRDQLTPTSHVFQHAVRLTVVSTLAVALGIVISAYLPSDQMLSGHGFWIVIATALIVFPDYGSTMARGIGRTTGTVLGMGLGIALAFVPYHHITHGLILLALFLLYLAFRSMGQLYTMLFVVAWIAHLTPGVLGATTRAGATVIGVVLAFAAFLLFPSYQRRMLTRRLRAWALSAADKLDALAALWSHNTEAGRRHVADTTVRGRLARLDFCDSARQALVEPADKHGRWTNAALLPSVDSVSRIGATLAGFAALGQTLTDDDRPGKIVHADLLAREFRALADDLASADARDVFGSATAGRVRPAADGESSEGQNCDVVITARSIDDELAGFVDRLRPLTSRRAR
ncbi:FUSC family protein [Gordonia sp. PP30]|uniref:FUSC family protein n=1 Tax=Gordonia sp. PP30 TaxID=2935861 RepID=UPI0020003047|nr:FUSC family protein [Gordonia sp. PP30]UQE73263.1 FUSC family protein [Gordonia sp. PP30]